MHLASLKDHIRSGCISKQRPGSLSSLPSLQGAQLEAISYTILLVMLTAVSSNCSGSLSRLVMLCFHLLWPTSPEVEPSSRPGLAIGCSQHPSHRSTTLNIPETIEIQYSFPHGFTWAVRSLGPCELPPLIVRLGVGPVACCLPGAKLQTQAMTSWGLPGHSKFVRPVELVKQSIAKKFCRAFLSRMFK